MDECGGVRVHFPPSGSSNDEVRISGPTEDVERAKKALLELADETVRLFVCLVRCSLFILIHDIVYVVQVCIAILCAVLLNNYISWVR